MHKFWITNKANKDKAEIYLYGYIDPFDVSAGDFIKELRSLEKEYSNIDVRINSGGGSVFEGLAIYNAMQQSSANINTYVDGLAASMGSIIMLAGKKCYMSKSAMVMTHKPSVGSWGNSEEHKKNAQLLDSMEATMAAIYSAKTGKTADDCKTCFLNGKDNWFTADEAKNEGLVDEIYDSPAIKAPTEKADAKHVWSMYNTQQFAAVFTNQKLNDNDMKGLSPAAMTALNITDVNDQPAIDAAIVAMAANVASLQTQLKAANTAKTTAENELMTYKEAATAAEVKAVTKAALDAKKITASVATQLEKDYAGKPTELKALIDAMPAFGGVVTAIENAAGTSDIADLVNKTYSELDKIDGALAKLKAADPELFKQKYKAQYGSEYSGK